MSRQTVFVTVISSLILAYGAIDSYATDRSTSRASKMILQPTSSDTLGSTDTRTDQADSSVHIWSLGGNGWALRINDVMLVFDYVERIGAAPHDSGETQDLQNGYIVPDELKSLDVYVFVTHAHQDHFDPVIFEWQDKIDRITYFFGWQAGHNPEHNYMVGPRAHIESGSVEVFTINSDHDGIPEVAYLVKVDGMNIYHNGDYRASYSNDFEYLGEITDHIDIAFVIGWPYVNHQHFQQAKLMVKLFSPVYMFAICREGGEDKCRQFAELFLEQGIETNVLYARHRGDSFAFSKTEFE